MTVATQPKTKNRYRVVAGIHAERQNFDPGVKPSLPGNTKVYSTNDIVESEEELDKQYVGKFEKVIEAQKQPVTEARRQAVAQLILQGQWGEDDRTFLEELPEDGFRRIVAHSGAKLSTVGDAGTQAAHGVNVTDNFQQAYDNQFRVYQRPDGKHMLFRGGAKKPLNDVPLDAAEVEPFVANYMKNK